MNLRYFHTAVLGSFLALLLLPAPAPGQQSNTLYLLHQVPQSSLLNPAVQLQCKWYVGIPVLASVHTSYSNTAFTWNDLAGSSQWNLYGIEEQMHRADLFSAEASVHILSLGYRHQGYYFTFSISDRAHVHPTFPGDLATALLHGNAAFAGERASFNALRPNGYYHRNYAVGLSRVFSPRWTGGVRARLLFGKASLYTGRSRSGLTTDENSFRLLLEGDYILNSSFPLIFTEDAEGNISDVTPGEIEVSRMLMNRRNPGFAIDLGAIYRYDEKITLSASLLDLGLVRWRTDLTNISARGSFSYDGVRPGSRLISAAYVAEMRDSVISAFDVTRTGTPYSSFLPVQLFLGGSYRVSDMLMVGVVNRNVFFRSKVHSSATFLATADLFERFTAGLSWSLLNNSVKNIGAVLAFHGRGFQFHLVSDNLTGFFDPFNTRSLSLRAGFNLMLGCPREKKGKYRTETYGPRPAGGDCTWSRKYRFRKKYRKKDD